ncbi:MAG: transposase [Nitrososphaerota archaeon]|nr:transposase [Nitrososphaerota archaeon]
MREALCSSSVVNVDETSLKVDGVNYWFWVFTTAVCTLFVVRKSRGKKVLVRRLVHSVLPYMRFLYVKPRICLQLLSDSTSQWTPLLLANSSYCKVCSGLTPPSYQTCRAHEPRNHKMISWNLQ